MMASLFAGVSGLRNHMVRMNLVGDNIANINTIGFKTGRVTFREALVQTLRGAGRPSATSGGFNPVQLGLGMNVATVDNSFSQGGLETTGQLTDLALQGSGFFILSDGKQEYYTRAGAFNMDANSNLVNPANGFFVQGKMANTDGTIPATTAIGNIMLPFGQQDPAKSTTQVFLANNLDSTATTSSASLFSAGSTNIDSVTGLAADGAGGTHTLTITGVQPTNSTLTTAIVGGTTETATLSSLGVTQAGLDAGFTLSVDGGTSVPITGLTLTSTVADLVAAISKIKGVESTFVTASGQIRLTRSYAGAGSAYNITTNVSVAGDIANRIFGATAGSALNINNGTANTFVVSDVFQPNGGLSPLPAQNLGVTLNSTTGLVTGISGLGKGGVSIISSSQLAAGTAVIRTADTQHATSISVYDSQGGKHTVVFTFTKQVTPNMWRWKATMAGNEIARSGDQGTLSFNSNGSLANFTFDDLSSSLSIDPNNGAAVMDMKLFPGTGGDFDGLTGFAASFSAIAKNQNGYGMGMLDKISIDDRGVITGIFTNGVSRTLAQIILADFNNASGLLKAGDTMFTASANSGDPVRGVAGATINASISSGALEGSNVDLAEEFTNVIVSQRGFQANARVISTSDQMLNELVNLKQ
ncbi:MAG: flagellar hook-basal body complex protein [candidate division Zixibacteria bacterium]|nr:flagellar hook-basal body complex protein [candidate division Zixibacteria bacterium]